MSIEAITFAKFLDLGDASPALHLLLSRIAEHQYNDSRVCRVSQEQLAVETARANVRSVRRWLAELEERRVIIRRQRRNEGGHTLPDEIRIVGFTRWYRSQVSQIKGRKGAPDKLSGGCEDGDRTGQFVRPRPDSRSPPATGQQESGTYKDNPTLLPTLSPLPPADGGQAGEGEGEMLFAKGWDGDSRLAAKGLVRRRPDLAPLIGRLVPLLNPPSGTAGAAWITEIGQQLPSLEARAADRLAEALLAERKRDLPSVADTLALAKRLAALPEAIGRDDARWPALVTWISRHKPMLVEHVEQAQSWPLPEGAEL